MAAAKEAKGTADSLGTGRRKTAVARVACVPERNHPDQSAPMEEYFPSDKDRRNVLAPLIKTGKVSAVDVSVRVHGGGIAGQSARACWASPALKIMDGETEEALRQNSLLTRDSRMKERKHYGLRRPPRNPVLEALIAGGGQSPAAAQEQHSQPGGESCPGFFCSSPRE